MADVYGEDLIAKFETQLGHPLSGDYDMRNGYDHPWAYYCEAGVESTGRNCGLDVPARGSASGAGLTEALAGMLRHDAPQHGGVIVFGPSFYYPWGHTGFWHADRGQLLGTLTDGTGVGYKNWGPHTGGYAGWYWLDGTLGPKRDVSTDPEPPTFLRPPDNPWEDEETGEIVIAGGFLQKWTQVSLGTDPYTIYGFPMNNETKASLRDVDGSVHVRTIQQFERLTLQWIEENAFPWDVCAVPLSTVIGAAP